MKKIEVGHIFLFYHDKVMISAIDYSMDAYYCTSLNKPSQTWLVPFEAASEVFKPADYGFSKDLQDILDG